MKSKIIILLMVLITLPSLVEATWWNSFWDKCKNITAFTTLSAEAPQNAIKLYRTTGGIRELTEIINYTDTNNNNLIDYIEWIVPSLSNETYEVEIIILNVQSYPKRYGNWIVRFNATGTANLTITPLNGTTWSNENENEQLKFLEVRCGDEILDYEWIDNGPSNSSVFIENYECNETGYEISKVLISGRHILKFQFGDDVKYAYNSPSPDTFFDGFESGSIIAANWSTYSSTAYGRIQVVSSSTDFGIAPPGNVHSGTYAVWMDVDTDGNYNLNELITAYDFSDASNIILDFWTAESQGGDEENACPASWVGHSDCEGVAFTCDNTTWYLIANISAVTTWTNYSVNISADPDFCSEINSSFAVKFSQYDNYQATPTTYYDGYGFDDINITYEIVDVTAPTYSNNKTNTTSPQNNEWVSINVTWTDANPAQAWFGNNFTGTWINDTPRSYTSGQDISNITQITAGEGKEVCWQAWANDTANKTGAPTNYINETLVSCITVRNVAPTYTKKLTNTTSFNNNDWIQINTTWTDETSLNYTWCGNNFTGNWINETPVARAGSTSFNHTNVTQITIGDGGVGCYICYANDTSGNLNETTMGCITSTAAKFRNWLNSRNGVTKIRYWIMTYSNNNKIRRWRMKE